MLTHLFSSYPGDYTADQFMHAFSFANPHIGFNLTIAGLTFLFGYLEYMYSFALVIKEHSAPYPLWMHTYYFAHDSMGALVFAIAAMQHQNFWLFWGASGALIVWNFFELFNLYKAITVERQAIWGPVSVWQALGQVIIQILLMVTVVNLFRIFMHDPLMFKWFIFTNVVMAVAPGYYWKQRGTRVGASRGLAIVILLGTINNFIPNNMWALASPMFSFKNNPWFYLVGIMAIAFAVRGLLIYNRLASKPKQLGKHHSVW